MKTVEKRTISLPSDQAAFIDAKVEAGEYASVSEVVRAGLRALKEQDQAIEHWLREEVAQAYDEMKANPSRGISLQDAFAEVRARGLARSKGNS